MENRTLEDLRQGLLDGKLRIRHNGMTSLLIAWRPRT